MEKPSSATIRLFFLTLSLIGLGILSAILKITILWFILFAVLCLYFLIRYHRNIRRADIILGAVMALTAMVSNPLMGFFVFPGYVAAMAKMRDAQHPIVLFHHQKQELWKTIGWILVAGSGLGIFNLGLGLGHLTAAPSFRFIFLFDALRAGLFEEILFRVLLYAICIEVTGGTKLNRVQSFFCLVSMIMPHVLIHFSRTIDIGSLIVMTLAFGLPFALLQWKVNLTSAIGAHALVDFIRFLVFGA